MVTVIDVECNESVIVYLTGGLNVDPKQDKVQLAHH